jgi:hypothetical protein
MGNVGSGFSQKSRHSQELEARIAVVRELGRKLGQFSLFC